MAAKSVLQPINLDRSPSRKRAKYDYDFINKRNPKSDRWSLTSSEVVLHSIYDLGVGRLDSDSESTENNTNLSNEVPCDINSLFVPLTPKTKAKQISAIEASLPENTLQKLSSGELDHILIKHTNDSNTNENMNYFDLLSDEVVLCILQKLPRVQLPDVKLVSRRFRRLVEDETLWTRMDVSNTTLEPGKFGVVMSRQVVLLRAARAEVMYPPILPHVKASAPNYRCRLMYLDLSMACISTESLSIIFSRCKRLQKLSLENVPIDENVLIALAGNKDIEVINLALSTGIQKGGLKYLLTNCRKIRELNISWTYLDAASIDYICENLPASLDRLNISGCRKLLEDKNISDLVSNCPHLRELDLSDCTALTGQSIRQITTLEELNFLALSRCYLIPYRALFHLKKVKSLSYLDIHGGYIDSREMKILKDSLGEQVNVNKFLFSSVARPTVGPKRSSIWNMRVRD